MVMPPYSHVFFATELAPEFLQNFVGKTGNGWACFDHLFDL
jgi:hypothetical protein